MTASRLRISGFLAGAVMAAAVVQAQQPAPSAKSTAAATAPASAQKAADAGKATQAKPLETAAAQKPADPSPEFLRDVRNAGFKPEKIRGTMMYCRTAIELGSNFPVRTCYDEDQVRIKIHEYQTERNQLQQMHNTGIKGN